MPAREGGRRAASPREQGAGKQGSRCRRARRARRKRRVTTWAGGGLPLLLPQPVILDPAGPAPFASASGSA